MNKIINLIFFLIFLTINPNSYAEQVNYAVNSTVTTEAALEEFPAHFAIDGRLDTHWNSGHLGLSWIEIDLGSSRPISKIQATVQQKPAGDTVHNVFVDDVLTTSWEQHTETGIQLTYNLPANTLGQKIRIETVSSPSWAAWQEVSVLGPDTNTASNAVILNSNLDLFIPVIEYQAANQSNSYYSANLEYIGTDENDDLLWKLKDFQEVAVNSNASLPSNISETASLLIQFSDVSFGSTSYWADLQYIGDNGEPGALVWKLLEYGTN